VGRLRLVNATARAMMADGIGVAETSGRIATPTRPGALEAPVAAAVAGRLVGRDSLVALPRGIERPLLARVFSITGTGVEGAGACVLLVDPDDPVRLDASGIAALELLTAAEAEVVSLLVRGAGTVEIAERRDTTPETTRGQIRSAGAKLGCRTRVDLLRLAMATRAPVRGPDDDPPQGG
jgi:DNA-binding CsgD family transcriptional regulator